MSIRNVERAPESERSAVGRRPGDKRLAQREEAMRVRAVRNRRVEAVAIAVLALLPVVPHLTLILGSGVPRYNLIGDLALLEQATRRVVLGDTLLGAPSRFQFNQPGPLFFVIAAPFQALFGSASTGLFVGAIFVNALSAAAVAGLTRLFGRRAHAVAAGFGVHAWFAAFGNVTANPWSPLLITLPLMAFLVSAGMLARGKSYALYPFVFFGALAGQTHVAAVTTTLIVGVVAVVAFLIGARRRGGLDADERWRIAISIAMLFALSIPLFVDQLMASTGNMKRLYRFFIFRSSPLDPISIATTHWTAATSWLFSRVASHALIDEGAVPLVASSGVMPTAVSANARLIAIVHVMTIAIATIVAARRRDTVSLALLGVGVVGDAVAVITLQAVVGPTFYALALFTTAASTIAWVGVFATLLSFVGARALRMKKLSGVIPSLLVVGGLTTTVVATSMQRFWIARNPSPPATVSGLSRDLEDLADGLRKATEDGSVLVVHREPGSREIADALVLELDKDGIDVRVSNADRDAYAGVRTANGVQKPLHVWFDRAERVGASPRAMACRRVLAQSGALTAYGANQDVACAD